MATEFERTVLEFMSKTSADTDVLKEHIQHVHKWTIQQEKESHRGSRDEQLKDVLTFMETSVATMPKLNSDDPIDVLSGCLALIGAGSVLISGPIGIITGSLCSIIASILSASRGTQMDLATQFHVMLRTELNRFKQGMARDELAGLEVRISNFMKDLCDLRSGSPAPRDEELSLDLLSLIGKIANMFTEKSLHKSSSKEDKEDFARAVCVYTLAYASTHALLTTMLCKYTELKIKTNAIKNQLETLNENAKLKLGFLVDEGHLTFEGSFADGKLYKILALRQHHTSYRAVDKLLNSLGLGNVPELDIIEAAVKKVAGYWIMLDIDGVPTPHRGYVLGMVHYFQLINKTDFPIRIISGTAGNLIKHAKFEKYLERRDSYEQKITGLSELFSAGGYFVLYLDGKLPTRAGKYLEGNIKVIEFSMSNPFMGGRKIKILDGTDHLGEELGARCWDSMTGVDMTPIFWVHNKRHYMATCYITMAPIVPLKTHEVWRFIVQEVFPREDAPLREDFGTGKGHNFKCIPSQKGSARLGQIYRSEFSFLQNMSLARRPTEDKFFRDDAYQLLYPNGFPENDDW